MKSVHLCFFILSALAHGSTFKTQDVLTSADRAIRRGTEIILEGDVQVIFQDQHLSAAKARLNTENKTIHAQGDVIFLSDNGRVEAQEIFWNYQTNRGVILGGFIESGQVYFEGDRIEKTGEVEYVGDDAYFTACNSCPAGWSFTGRRIQAELGGYAYLKQPLIRVASVPVLWLPYLVVPLKSQRQSGFLWPSFGNEGLGGFALSQSFFWAISRSQDATFTAKYYLERSLKGLGEYRYRLDKDSGGQLNYAYINDTAFPREKNLMDYNPQLAREESISRWHLNYNHSYDLPEGFVQKAKIRLVRDLRYIRDFDAETRVTGEPALENRLSLTKNQGAHHMSADALYYVGLLKENPMANNRDAVHRIPDLRYSLTDSQVGNLPVRFQFDGRYSSFVRTGSSFDNISRRCSTVGDWASRCVDEGAVGADAQFNPETDIVRSGQRLMLNPALSMPLNVAEVVQLYPRVSYMHQQYNFPVDPRTTPGLEYSTSPYRRYVTSELGVRTQLSRVYGSNEDEDKYKHQLEPEAFVMTTPYLEQTRHPFFSPLTTIPAYRLDQPLSNEDVFAGGGNDFPGIQFDYMDRMYNRNITGLGFNNYLTRKRIMNSGKADYIRTLRVSLTQFYDLDEARKAEEAARRPWSNLRSIIDARLDNFNTNTIVDYFHYHRVTNVSSRARLFDRFMFAELAYNLNFILTEVIPADVNRRNETIGLGGGFTSRYLKLGLRGDYSRVSNQMQSINGIIGIQPPGDCMALEVEVWQPLGLMQERDRLRYSFRFSFKFDS